MQTNGLIFLVIVAIWAVYLLQHWVRRRENLATARSVDRFSEAMRVLERRRHTPHVADPAPVRVLSNGPAERPTAPTVSVKPVRPSLHAGVAMNQSNPSSKRFAGFGRSSDPAARSRRPARAVGETTPPVSVSNRFFKVVAAMTPARIRAGALITAAVIFVATVVLTPLSVVPWWSPLLGLVLLAGVVGWLRSRVIRGARDQRAARTGAARPKARASQPRADAPAARSTPAQDTPLYDADAPVVEAPAALAAQEAPVEAPGPGTWAPVAVPPPTYTLKARADRPEPEPAATVEPATPAAKYADTPVEDLPFDGMALDEDLEELPAVHRAG
ncbi:hypothetical protein [Demetria terragena]|uniref:hypothetical protein n=1 Tax=Demetria terragena TaxID=63959 RepID=UPI0012E9C729|nr:hypothetical protein [Demetria terragena]